MNTCTDASTRKAVYHTMALYIDRLISEGHISPILAIDLASDILKGDFNGNKLKAIARLSRELESLESVSIIGTMVPSDTPPELVEPGLQLIEPGLQLIEEEER